MVTQFVKWRGDAIPFDEALTSLRSGGVLVYPTETVYGIGLSLSAVERNLERLRRIKGSPANRPYLLLVADSDQAFSLWSSLPEPAVELAERYWPGPLTMIGPAASGLPATLLGSVEVDGVVTATVSVRVPGDERIRELITRLGEPLLSTSANRRGSSPPVDFSSVDVEQLAPDLAIDAGPCVGGEPSTLVSLMSARPRVLRQGALQLELAK